VIGEVSGCVGPFSEAPATVLLTVIVPAYNEAATIADLLKRVHDSRYEKLLVIVDDGSTDRTSIVVDGWCTQQTPVPSIELRSHALNRGKGAAIRSGLAAARGDVVLIQDADLEYDPADYPALVEPILKGEADVVFGSRYLRRENHLPWTANRLCVHLLNLMVRVLYGRKITDEATCYKAFRTDVLRRMDLRCERFEFCPEVTAKACRMRLRIREVPIRYTPRTKAQGKKIRWRDGVQAIWTLVYWRFARFRPLEALEFSLQAASAHPGPGTPTTQAEACTPTGGTLISANEH
jgi:glycosyltransferase involved in cell wall biosynthesis